MVLSAFAFSVMSALVKLAGERLDSQQIVFARSAVTLVMSWVALRRRNLSPWGNDKKRLLLRGLFGFGGLTCYYYSVTKLPLADATVIHFTNPVLTAVIAAVVLRERFGALEAFGAAVGLLGVVAVARPSFVFDTSPLDPVAVGVGLVGAVCAALAYATIRSMREGEDPLVVVFYFPLVALPLSIATVADRWLWPTPLEWLTLLGVGIATQIGQVALTYGLHQEPAGRATAIGYLQVAFAFGWGTALFGEVPTAWTLAGALAIVAGIALVLRARRAE